MGKLIDARGKQCPVPVIEAKNALKEISEGILEVLVDNDIAVQNLIKLASYLNIEAVSNQQEEALYQVIFTVGEPVRGDSIETVKVQEGGSPNLSSTGKVVAVSSDQMGGGDEVLGRILMKGFLFALAETDYLPETILFYNSGARLTVQGSESVEDLKNLETQGVEILTCGTCLGHYGLTDQLMVGTVTNMYTIAEKLMGAAVVIRP